MKTYNQLKKLKKFNSICLIGHTNPDADAISSMVVFKDFLIKYLSVKNVDLFAETYGSIDYIKPILSEEILNSATKDYDCAILLDCPNADRTGCFKNLYENAKFKVIIDHHITTPNNADISISKTVSSTCEIIYSILKYFKFPLSIKNKENLYTGIITDTNNFTVGNFNRQTFQIAGELIEGIDNQSLYQQFLNTNSLKTMQVLSKAIENISTYENEKIILSHITHEEAKLLEAEPEDFSCITNKLSSITNNIFTAFIYPKDDKFYASLRAKKGYNVAKIAESMNGGGHLGAAAFRTDLSVTEVENYLRTQFSVQLKAKD